MYECVCVCVYINCGVKRSVRKLQIYSILLRDLKFRKFIVNYERFLPFSDLAEFGYLIHFKNHNNRISSLIIMA